MKENVWAKTILSVYRYLERICGSIDKMVESRAMASFYVCSVNFANSNIINVADKIIALTERKKTLINLKILANNALEKCKPISAEILIEKYIDGDKSNDIAERHNLPMRSYFRKLSNAETEFGENLASLGYNEKKLNSFLPGEKWICDVYARLSDESKENKVKQSPINNLQLQLER